MIAFYVGKPSSYLDLPKGNFRFRDDGFEMRRSSENPLIEDQQGKKDWAISNKCVGFNVDVGIRNQNVFYNFTISQDAGKATSESIQTQLNMIDQANGRQISTQNNSLYNFYKQRSYQCTVQCLGNALLQPTMYFNLRHVPMFNGPYMITEVSHTITPGGFETTVSGIRQSVYDLPVLDNFLQSINRNLLTKIEALTVTKKDQPTSTTSASTNSNKSSNVVQSAGSVKAAENSCGARLNPVYERFESTKATETSLTPEQMKDVIVRNISDPILQTIVYCICYFRTFQQDRFVGFNNNFATLQLTEDYGARNNYFFPTTGIPQYICLDVKSTTSTNSNTQPIAMFSDINKFVQFMRDSLQVPKDKILQPGIGLPKYYVCNWPKNNNIPETYYDQNKDTEFKQIQETFDKALKSAISVGLADVKKSGEVVGGNSTVTPTPTPTRGTTAPTVSSKIECTPTPTPSITPPIKIITQPKTEPQTIKTKESQPQQTGPIPLIATYKKVLPPLYGDESITVIINPELTDWEIVSESTKWSWRAVKTVYSNNQKTEVELDHENSETFLKNYVYNNKQGFYVDNLTIIREVESNFTEAERKEISSISSQIKLVARSKNSITKYEQTNDPKDIIPYSYQNFNFLVVLK
jgi:hypothetical protein